MTIRMKEQKGQRETTISRTYVVPSGLFSVTKKPRLIKLGYLPCTRGGTWTRTDLIVHWILSPNVV